MKAASEAAAEAAALQQCSHHEKDGVRSPKGGSVNIKKLFFCERECECVSGEEREKESESE